MSDVLAPPPIAAFDLDGAAAVLDRIVDPHLDLVIWARPRPVPLAWLDSVDWKAIDDIDCTITTARLAADLPGLIAAAGYPGGRKALALAREIHDLAMHLAGIAGRHHLRLRLEVIESDACRRFHADFVTLRLLTTFVGRGTQWIEAMAPDDISEMQAGDVAIFKGRLSKDEPAILHRSPPIGRSGEKRLLLAIDPLISSDRVDAS